VLVTDTTRAPVVGAEISVVRGLKTQLVSGTTDVFGLRELRVPRDEEEHQIVVRRIGFERAERFFARPAADTVALRIELHRFVQHLAPVTVTEDEDRTRRHYHLEADEITNSNRLLYDATDVLMKIRPEMMGAHGCPLSNVCVNGSRVVFAYRRRILGVFNEKTGDPITGAEVIDLASGLRSRTSVTGAVSLMYLPEGKSAIRIHRDGFSDLDMDVTIEPGRTNPITVVVTPTP
jgi:hypothetical protein